jgi:hypothetical protein
VVLSAVVAFVGFVVVMAMMPLRARPLVAVGTGVVVVPVAATFARPVLAAGRAATWSARRTAVGDRNRTPGTASESEDRQDSRDP